ncbi:hypothetical protein D4A47_13515 [Anaerotruncus massiliensis (ex Liu et al. 2021)]|uniref:Uncharacterized protein n=1 Tax=Anaerotruncus massiliensis (ex Liu et al. 2021) TaxID=2321404 RepID=A0A498CIX3_9FIRM|nr:hypothetical protein D4A47_13515 [Anaerotruncus massiliensis (ex Liu et al. 2021)]
MLLITRTAIILVVYPVVYIFQTVCAGIGVGFDVDRPDEMVNVIDGSAGFFLAVTFCGKATNRVIRCTHKIHIDDPVSHLSPRIVHLYGNCDRATVFDAFGGNGDGPDLGRFGLGGVYRDRCGKRIGRDGEFPGFPRVLWTRAGLLSGTLGQVRIDFSRGFRAGGLRLSRLRLRRRRYGRPRFPGRGCRGLVRFG